MGQRASDGPIKVQLKCPTSGAKIFWAFNSSASTPPALALEGGQPMAEEPYGTGRGKLDGSQPLPSKFMAGCASGFEYVELMTSGSLTAFASKEGLADSVVIQSDEFTIAGR